MDIRRGDIYYVERSQFSPNVGSEQSMGRPAIIVSNDANNANSNVFEVVYLTTQPKANLPTHIDIRSAKKMSIALCEQVTSISVERLGDYIGSCSEQEMVMLDAALAISLDLNCEAQTVEKNVERPIEGNKSEEKETIIKLSLERDMYKALYEQILEKLFNRN